MCLYISFFTPFSFRYVPGKFEPAYLAVLLLTFFSALAKYKKFMFCFAYRNGAYLLSMCHIAPT